MEQEVFELEFADVNVEISPQKCRFLSFLLESAAQTLSLRTDMFDEEVKHKQDID